MAMPSIRYKGFRLTIRTNDHDPPHVHVIREGGELKIILGGDDEEPFLERILSPMKKNDTRNALHAVKAKKTELREIWRAIHERD